MKNYACSNCGNKVYFENVRCVRCEAELGFDPEKLDVVTIEPIAETPGTYRQIGRESGPLAYCVNSVHAACNWLTPAGTGDGFCRACDLNRTIPDLTAPGNLEAWQELERAKKRLVYDLLRFGLPVDLSPAGTERLAFDFLVDATTGHLDGVITINVLEADAVERERQRQHFGEPYRSLLGHLRHESGHFYWNVLIDEQADTTRSGPYSATSARTMPPPSRAITPKVRRPIGRPVMCRPMPAHIRGRIGRRPGRTTCTWYRPSILRRRPAWSRAPRA